MKELAPMKETSKVITYRRYKNFNSEIFNKCLVGSLSNCKNCSEYEGRFLEGFNMHAPLKKKDVRANEVPYMTKALRKAFADRSRLENRYYKNRSVESLLKKSSRIFVVDFIKGNAKILHKFIPQEDY